jgi:hypothetical protein
MVGRQQAADDLRRMKGLPTAGDRQAQVQNQQAVVQKAEQAEQLQAADAAATIGKKQADIAHTNALARKEHSQASLMDVQSQTELQPDEDELIKKALQTAETT